MYVWPNPISSLLDFVLRGDNNSGKYVRITRKISLYVTLHFIKENIKMFEIFMLSFNNILYSEMDIQSLNFNENVIFICAKIRLCSPLRES